MKKALLYCAGAYCRTYIKYFINLYDVLAIVDMNTELQGKSINDIPIISLEQINQYMPDIIVIASSNLVTINSVKNVLAEIVDPKIIVNGDDILVSEFKCENSTYQQTYIDCFNNKLIIDDNVAFKSIHCHIVGCNNVIHIKRNVSIIEYLYAHVTGNANSIEIGEKTSMFSCFFELAEGGRISIGKDCMFASDIELRQSASHPFFDMYTGERLNISKNISIGNHVWVGKRVCLLSGFSIGNESIVGYGAISSSAFGNNVVIAGNPAKIIRENVVWTRAGLEMM